MHGTKEDINMVSVHRLLMALQPFFILDNSIPARCVQAFLMVSEAEGMGVVDLARAAKISPSTMSRNLLDLGERDRYMQAGLGLVRSQGNVEDKRRSEYFLTPKGRALLRKVVQAMN